MQSIEYTDTGPRDGLPLLLVHGHPFDRTMWRHQIARFGATHRVIAPDLRGYGQTPGTVSAWTDFADDIAALLAALRVPSAVVAGLSMGGQIVLDLQHRYPHLVAGLLLVDTEAGPETDPQARRAAGARLRLEGVDPYAVEVLYRMVRFESAPEVAEHVLAMMRDTDPLGAGAAQLARAERPDHRPRLGSITVPTTVVVGAEDEFTPVHVARGMADAIPRAELVVIEGAAHMPPLEQPVKFGAAVAGLLARVTAAQGVARRMRTSPATPASAAITSG